MRIPHQKMFEAFESILLNNGFTENVANDLATVFAENSLEGVPSHGLNRFPDFIHLCKEGLLDKNATPKLETSLGALEIWDGHSGPGICNAKKSMARAMDLATTHGIGCVALKNTNHWMRGGTYGWQAAEKGFISINFTNATALMVPFGGLEARLGNNPLVIAIPDATNGPLVLDMALSQYSMGKVKNYKASGQRLDFDGGYDEMGTITNDPEKIVASSRLLSIGFWKGTGLSLMLDLMCSLLSGGRTTAEISAAPLETNVSQIFICFSLKNENYNYADIIEKVRAFTLSSSNDNQVHLPGQNVKKLRAENLQKGIPVDEKIWNSILTMI
ncbi:3-dehydro-L-gulonate 2-dehydrogenase [Pedobacter changchengzhani]|uniref:3-dehydro-L-gulonate 2-dehydrogenase n=2 Tax=Pedobacter changchengzhani TaxID=2529274 RepID=A0A4R5MLU0_9SPHI|nr:3-dehydro-L-gulonate 2-dehydrogenase [Pedobacter changchengzhani]